MRYKMCSMDKESTMAHPVSPYLRDRARGVLVGQACGDALGAQVEFSPRDTFVTPRNFADGGPHRLLAGQWTDDTAMAIHLAEYMIEHDDWKYAALMERWWSWY